MSERTRRRLWDVDGGVDARRRLSQEVEFDLIRQSLITSCCGIDGSLGCIALT